MANPEHRAKLTEGVEAWNHWRKVNPDVKPDLREASLRVMKCLSLSGADLSETDLRMADLSHANLSKANLSKADLRGAYSYGSGADLSEADLSKADLRGANLSGRANLTRADLRISDLRKANLGGANLREADLRYANLSDADLTEANFIGANLRQASLNNANLTDAVLRGVTLTSIVDSSGVYRMADLNGANLSGADLQGANLSQANLAGANLSQTNLSGSNLSGAFLYGAYLIETNLEAADLTSCSVFGISVWGINVKGAIQSNLVITRPRESIVQVDNLEVAQFIYLILNNSKIREVIDTIASKVVLILGRFTAERKALLDAVREELRKRNYLPVLFDFQKPDSRNFTETVSTLAHMARFVIADITDPRSIPQELTRIIPLLPSVPVKPLLLASQQEYGMFTDFRAYPWVLEPYCYPTDQILLAELDQMVIAPAEAKAKELTRK